ncbi:hypothetical protein KY289_004124 [Solanum tuberosum]|nr:hypothetical protein KY289_004124 [Solanum tuberosum]
MDAKNLQTWTIMISGPADHGHGEEVVSLFARMEQFGFRPDCLSFSAILYACSHIGFVDAGHEYIEKMASIYNIRPTMEHYGCMVDMFGRAGELEEAYDIIRSMPTEPNSVILRSFISACKHHGRNPCVEENRCEQPKIDYESKRDKEISWQQLEEAIQITGMKEWRHCYIPKMREHYQWWRKINCFFLGNTTRLRYKFRGTVALTIGTGSWDMTFERNSTNWYTSGRGKAVLCQSHKLVCGHCLMIGTGGSLHSMAVKSGFGSDLHVNNTLLRMYTGFGVIRFARLVFDEMLQRDIVSWSSMMATYVHWDHIADFNCL